MTLSEDVSLEEFVVAKDDLSGADIKAVCTEAGMLALRERRMKVTQADLRKAKEKADKEAKEAERRSKEKAEKEAATTFSEMRTAKTAEIDACTAAIEDKMKRIGDLGVKIVGMKQDLTDAEESLVEDKKFLAELEKGCATKEKEWAEICKIRQEEILALADTIKILNDDDALELFKKTLPSASSSFVQIKVSSALMRKQALALLKAKAHSSQRRPQLDLIEMALQGKQMGFEKVISMIDEMVVNLKKEQEGDDSLKAYCDKEFDESDDKKKMLELSIGDSETAIEELEGAIAQLKADIEALEDGVKALDKSVAEATDMRKQEHSDYEELMASDTNAKEVLLWAKNRLNKFYNPKLYKPAAKAELSSEGRIVESFKLVQISQHVRAEAAPPPAPETADYSKKGEESTGVIAMIDLLVAEMDKEMTEAEAEEKNAQDDYEKFVEDCKEKRRADTKSMEDKESSKADMEETVETQTAVVKDTTKELYATLKFIDSLHAECDFLLDFYEVRKQARATEVKGLTDAKAVLSGADYSLIQQTSSHTYLRRR